MRRAWFVLISLSWLALAGCGFHLRGQEASLARLPPVELELRDARAPLGRAVLSAFAQHGVTTASKDAALRVHVTQQREERRSRTLTRGIQVAEYDLNVELRYELYDSKGQLVLPEQRLFATRVYARDASNLLTNETTEDLLWQELRADIAQQLVGALAARRPVPGA